MADKKRDFLSISDLTQGEFSRLLARAAELKAARARGKNPKTLADKVVATVYEKASTRTRVSFEAAIFELGGHAVYLSDQGSQLSRGEPIQDMARVLGSYCHAIVIRTYGQERAAELARWAPVPVINGLTDLLHPCQLAADLFTVHELRRDLRGLRYAWIGDGHNMANSWIMGAALLGLRLTLACPRGFEPDRPILAAARARIARQGAGAIELVVDPREAAAGADVISTDVWASMGQEAEAEQRRKRFVGYCVDEALLGAAAPEVIVLHCLPAHRGEEISEAVLEGPHSAVWRQAENRLHVQKAILELVLAVAPGGP